MLDSSQLLSNQKYNYSIIVIYIFAKSSTTENRTRILHGTGENTNHYTIADELEYSVIIFVMNNLSCCNVACDFALISIHAPAKK